MGLSNSDKTLPSALFKEKILQHDLFSLCLSQSGGLFSMGEVNDTSHLSKEIEYIPLQSSTYYAVKLSTISIEGETINVGVNTNTIIDSGTTIAYFPLLISNKIDEAIKRACNGKDCGIFTHLSDLGECISVRSNEHMMETIKLLPNITFEFANGVKYIWEPNDYVFNNTIANKKQYQICLGYTQGSGGKVNLGSTWMHNKDIIFDRENKRIGFVRANCNNNSLIPPKPDDNEGEKKNEAISPGNDACIDKTSNTSLIIYCSIALLMVFIIFFLSIALFRILRGKDCFCIKIISRATPQPIQFDRVIEESPQV